MKLFIEQEQRGIDVFKTWLMRGAVVLVFLSVGWGKFGTRSPWIKIFEQIGFGQWFRYFTGTLQITGALLVLIPRTFVLGILILACTMAGAAACWIFLLGEPFNAVIPVAILAGLLIIGGDAVGAVYDRALSWRSTKNAR